ncbi:MAG: AAA family ATPase [Gammaproteobacteria bacterium]|nr:AAA family ATPase [Gammaproteobacteria bacterium]
MSFSIMYQRYLKMDLPAGQSAFLWGARQTGKSTYLHQRFPDALYYDLLQMDIHSRFLTHPYLLREELLALPPERLRLPVIIDEIQKIPMLLNEVHGLIESHRIQFILCGSSARKLKRGAANLLGGRAWRYVFYPLVYPEIPAFNLLTALNRGLIPSHYQSEHYERSLKAYIYDYLKEEIQAEGLVRNLPAFARFLDMQVHSHGQLVNYSNIARDCAIDSKTVKEYYQILVDTLLGYFVEPYHARATRNEISHVPKFYLFDVGVANALLKQSIVELRGQVAGQALEHYILTEIVAYRGLNDLDFPIKFWRTKTGLEVDFILGDAEVAIEVKISQTVHQADLKGLIAFSKEYTPRHTLVVSQDAAPRRLSVEGADILILPWKDFLTRLWAREWL